MGPGQGGGKRTCAVSEQAHSEWATSHMNINTAPFVEELWEPVPLGHRGLQVDSEPQGTGRKMSQGLGWANGGGKGVPAPGPSSAHFLHPFPRYPGLAPVSEELPDFQ